MDEIQAYLPKNFDIKKYETKSLSLKQWGECLLYRRRLIDDIQKLEAELERKQYAFKIHNREIREVFEHRTHSAIFDKFKKLILQPVSSTTLYRCMNGQASVIALHKKEAIGLSGKAVPVLSVRRIRGLSQVIRGAVSDLHQQDIIRVKKVNKTELDILPTLKTKDRFLCTIDVGQSDEQIYADLKEWLQAKREKNGITTLKGLPSEATCFAWHRERILAYIDLLIWERLTNKSVSILVKGKILFPDAGVSEDVKERVRKTTKTRAEQALSDEVISSFSGLIYKQANNLDYGKKITDFLSVK